jgi:hypothetical protein
MGRTMRSRHAPCVRLRGPAARGGPQARPQAAGPRFLYDPAVPPTVRPALAADVDALTTLIACSARALSRGFYTEEQVEAAIRYVFGVDSQLIADGTYFAAVDGDTIAGCGGWSKRATLYGGDQAGTRSADLLDPSRDAARIRAFFVAPSHARTARRGSGASS